MRIIIGLLISIVVLNAMRLFEQDYKIKDGGVLSSTFNIVSAINYKIVTYIWIDAAGKVCTTIFINDKSGIIDCDFPPKDFDYWAFMKKTKNIN